MRRLVLLAALAALVACPAATGHGGGGRAQGFSSTVTALQPPTLGVLVEVLDGDDRLRLTNGSDETVLVLGYEEEPYLRLTPDGVYRNVRSPATYLNEDRYAQVELPASADANAPPKWEKLEKGRSVEWHDHRIHWMSTIAPPAVQAAKDSPHHIFDWNVPLEVDGRPVAILGSLDYTPPPASAFSPILIAPLAVLALLGALAWWLRAQKKRRSNAATVAFAGARAPRRSGGLGVRRRERQLVRGCRDR